MAALLTVLAAPGHAGTLTGTATFRERIALPPDAVFEVLIEESARADAPATVIGRQRLTPAGQPPFRFAIPYDDSAVSPRGRYALRATVRHRGELLFTTDTVTPVLNGQDGPVEILLVKVRREPPDRSRSVSAVLGTLPASWRGDIPDAGGVSRWQVDLSPDRTYQLRQTFVGRPAPNRFDDIGRWRLEAGTNRLVLRGGREAPLFLQPVEAGTALRKLDLEGRPIISRHNDLLNRLPRPAPIDPSLHLQGMFTYLADAATIRLCTTGQRLPVAMEGDYLALERATSRAQQGQPAGRPLLANLEGMITTRPSAEPGQPPRRTLVVQKFLNVWPGKGCPPALMAFEQSVLETLAQVRRWSIDRRTLLLQDATGRTLMVFQALG